jgi:hypothetical protein
VIVVTSASLASFGRKVVKLKHHQAGRLAVALKDDEFAAADEKPATAMGRRYRSPLSKMGEVAEGD